METREGRYSHTYSKVFYLYGYKNIIKHKIYSEYRPLIIINDIVIGGHYNILLLLYHNRPNDVGPRFLYLENACRRGHVKILNFFLTHFNRNHTYLNTCLSIAGQNEQFDMIRLLHSHGVDIHIGKEALLNESISNGNYTITQWVLEHGADVSKITYDNFTTARYRGYTNILSLIATYKRRNVEI
jgi:hypothetical protein